MSLVRIAARIAAVQALKGKTLVGDNVLDSQIGALDISADGTVSTSEEKRFITVYTDGTKSEDNASRALVPNGATEFLFEAGITAAMLVTNPETGESVVVTGVPDTDDAFEFYLDIVARQIGDVLTDPANEWAEIFRRLCLQIVSVERRRTGSADNGARLAAHQIKMTVDLVADPVKGVPLKAGSPMASFFTKAATLGGPIAAKVALMQAQVAGGIGGAEYSWQTALRRYGITREEGDALLLTTAEGAEADITFVEVDAAPAVPVGGAQ